MKTLIASVLVLVAFVALALFYCCGMPGQSVKAPAALTAEEQEVSEHLKVQCEELAHRIGQRRPVFAFRLIARDTVEEKVLELQASKRKLADAIVRADESLIRDLRKEDLELLLA